VATALLRSGAQSVHMSVGVRLSGLVEQLSRR
jgi:hypothetical protein